MIDFHTQFASKRFWIVLREYKRINQRQIHNLGVDAVAQDPGTKRGSKVVPASFCCSLLLRNVYDGISQILFTFLQVTTCRHFKILTHVVTHNTGSRVVLIFNETGTVARWQCGSVAVWQWGTD